MVSALWKLVLALACALFAGSAVAGNVTVKGSDTMVILAQRWAEEYMKDTAQAKIQVTGGGTGIGTAALVNGTTDIAMASRPISPEERQAVLDHFKMSVEETAVARDGVIFYVHESNPLSSLSLVQLRAIYQGDITRWSEVGGNDAPVVLYSRENSSGTYAFVKDELLQGEDYASEAQTLPGTAAVVNAVSKEPNGIGYGGSAYARSVKPLRIRMGEEEIAPSSINIKSGRYPLSRNLFFYTRGKAREDARNFVNYCLSLPGQQLVARVGYFPVNE